MQILQTPPLNKQRSMSYNDLKKKRLMRSKSHKKLINKQSKQTTVKKEMNEAKNILLALPQDQKIIENCINQLSNALGSLRTQSSKKRIISIRESQSQRSTIKQSLDHQNHIIKPIWNNVQQNIDTKTLIKQILNKNKSQRRLIKFNQARDKFKKIKQRSLSNDKKDKIKIIPSPIKDKTLLKVNSPILQIQQHQISQDQLEKFKQSKRGIDKKEWIQERGKQNQQINIQNLQFNNISCIMHKNNQKFDESQLKIIQGDTIQIKGSFLKLLNEDLQNYKNMGKQIRRKNHLQKIKKIFPSDFFNN